MRVKTMYFCIYSAENLLMTNNLFINLRYLKTVKLLIGSIFYSKINNQLHPISF